jgi:phage-related protein
LQGKLWEIRARGKDGIARAVYIAVFGKRVVILHVFVKKTQKTPPEAIELSLKRAKELGYL